jgi:hypothetical protein
MSYQIQATLFCDGCGASFQSGYETKVTQIRSVIREVNRKAMMASWLTLPRGRFRTFAHYCKDCADKPLPAKKQ